MSRPDARPEAERPDWASGAEWEGWKSAAKLFDVRGVDLVGRRMKDGTNVRISPTGILQTGATIAYLPSPAAALRVANAIAAELGGWS